MGNVTKVVVLVLVLGVAGSSLARVFLFDDGQPEFAVQRSNRQVAASGPKVEHVFAQINDPIQESELHQVVRPSRQVEYRTPRQSDNIQNTRWELGYDPSDILHPPELKLAETQYRTLNFYKKRKPEVESNPTIIWGTLKNGVVINRPHRSSLEGNIGAEPFYAPQSSKQSHHDEEEEDEAEEEEEEEGDDKSEEAGYSQHGHSYHPVPASIYSFVKTDEHGNFKWGVHQGPPLRG